MSMHIYGPLIEDKKVSTPLVSWNDLHESRSTESRVQQLYEQTNPGRPPSGSREVFMFGPITKEYEVATATEEKILYTKDMSDCVAIAVMHGKDQGKYAERRMVHFSGGDFEAWPLALESLFKELKSDDRIVIGFGRYYNKDSPTAANYISKLHKFLKNNCFPVPNEDQFDQIFTNGTLLLRPDGNCEQASPVIEVPVREVPVSKKNWLMSLISYLFCCFFPFCWRTKTE